MKDTGHAYGTHLVENSMEIEIMMSLSCLILTLREASDRGLSQLGTRQYT